ncbi:MAG: hypothetical protein AB7N65_15100 [Vicinamibacterales bacterium]
MLRLWEADYDAAVRRAYPKAASLSQRELEAHSAKFRYREILRYLSTETDLISQATPFLSKIVPVYASLSSYVHGGPWAQLELSGTTLPASLAECERVAGMASTGCASMVMMAAMAIGREFPEHLQLAENIKGAMDIVRGGDSEAGDDD